jgi:dihydropyrimidinase
MTVESPCGILGKVNPPIHFSEDVEVSLGRNQKRVVMTIGTDNVPAYLAKSRRREKTCGARRWAFRRRGSSCRCWSAKDTINAAYRSGGWPGFEHNTARKFLLPGKGEIKVGYDADLALVDLEWEREITPDLFGCSDYSIYAGMTFRGWPRYTISRGEIIQKDGRITRDTGPRQIYLPEPLI